MLQLNPVYLLWNRRRTLTGSPDPTRANGTNKPCSMFRGWVCQGAVTPLPPPDMGPKERGQYPPPRETRDTVSKHAVLILLKCCLVHSFILGLLLLLISLPLFTALINGVSPFFIFASISVHNGNRILAHLMQPSSATR